MYTRGLGAATDCITLGGWFTNSDCWGHSIPYWQQMATPGGTGLAPPPAPTGPALTVPPASGADAAALVQSLTNQQLAAQQGSNAAQVQPASDLYGTIADAGGLVPSIDWTKVALISGAVLAVLILLMGRR
jgi:hypothetical protein